MIDQERVREMTKLAACEKYEGKKYCTAVRFYRIDFVGRHLLKSFFCATIVYGMLLLLWGICHMNELAANLDTMDLVEFGVSLLIKYLLFLAVYLIAVDVYANMSYAAGRKSMKRYRRHLKRLGRLYEEQENYAASSYYDSQE